jgi:hypothetical protein
MGVGSEVYQSVLLDRKAIGIELKREYFQQAKKNLMSLDNDKNQITIDDYLRNLKV